MISETFSKNGKYEINCQDSRIQILRVGKSRKLRLNDFLTFSLNTLIISYRFKYILFAKQTFYSLTLALGLNFLNKNIWW